MKKNEEAKKEIRKESVSSSKSGDVSESESYQESIYIPIKKEKSYQ